jgi:hypothetical protein
LTHSAIVQADGPNSRESSAGLRPVRANSTIWRRNSDAFRWLLLAEDGAALVARDTSTVERWDVSASEAMLMWTVELSGYPLRARSDPAEAGRYLLALGFAGTAELP